MSSKKGNKKKDIADVAVRFARKTDLDKLVWLLGQLFAIEEDFAFNASLQYSGLKMMLSHENGVVLVAEAETEVIGMCSGQVTISTAEGGPALLVEDMVVDEHWRGKGVGRQLMLGIEKWAASRKIGRLQLLADKENSRALRFYEQRGWQITNLIGLRKRVEADK